MALLAFSGCSDTINYDNGEGEGRIMLHTIVKSDVKEVKRSAVSDPDLAETAIIWIANNKGVVREYNGLSAVPVEGIHLVSDTYKAMAWAGDSVPASFDKKFYRGAETFTIGAGETKQVELECKIVNVAVALNYQDGVADVLSDIKMTVGHKAGSLDYEGLVDKDVVGYFMMPSYDKDLTYTLTGKLSDGSAFTYSDVIADAKPATKYVINIKHSPGEGSEFGAALFDITVDESEIVVEDVIEIIAAPKIEALNFDFAQPVAGEEGTFTDKKVWIASAASLKSVEIRCNNFGDVFGIGGEDFDLLNMLPEFTAQIQNKGLKFEHFTHIDEEENPEYEEIKLNFSENLLNTLKNGEYSIDIIATDSNGKTSSAKINIQVDDAMVNALPVPENSLSTYATEVTLSALVVKEGAENLGFNYREVGTQEFTTVYYQPAARATLAPGQSYSVTITGLKPATRYEYCAICDGFSSTMLTFTTDVAPQLPNSSFEDWVKVGKITYPCLNPDSDMFWDTGNTGASKASTTLTEAETSLVHSGKFAARLETKKAAVLGIGKLAAGNIFIGKYLNTEGTDGVLGWGRPFTGRPKALKGYVKYTPATVSEDASDYAELKKGDMDQGIIYIALLDDSQMDYNGQKWPVVIKTKSSTRQLFDKNSSKVIAYGEKLFTEATPGDGLIEITIPLNYNRTDVRPSNIMLVCSASKGGDYFVGGAGSLMIIDDFELVY